VKLSRVLSSTHQTRAMNIWLPRDAGSMPERLSTPASGRAQLSGGEVPVGGLAIF
jgi:hypothetical protein